MWQCLPKLRTLALIPTRIERTKSTITYSIWIWKGSFPKMFSLFQSYNKPIQILQTYNHRWCMSFKRYILGSVVRSVRSWRWKSKCSDGVWCTGPREHGKLDVIFKSPVWMSESTSDQFSSYHRSTKTAQSNFARGILSLACHISREAHRWQCQKEFHDRSNHQHCSVGSRQNI